MKYIKDKLLASSWEFSEVVRFKLIISVIAGFKLCILF